MKGVNLKCKICLIGILVMALSSCGGGDSNSSSSTSSVAQNVSTEQDSTTKSDADLDEEKAKAVNSLIQSIGEVSLESEELINQARGRYDELTSTQKMLVSSYDLLVSAEERLKSLKEEVRQRTMAYAIGDVVTSDDWNISLTKAYTSPRLESSKSRVYWDADEGYAFLILEFDVTCLNSTQPTIDGDGITNLVATVNGNTYSNWTYQYVEGEIWCYIRRTYLDANLPLHIYVYTYIPSGNMNDEIKVELKVAGQDKMITLN
jgi:lipoprotein